MIDSLYSQILRVNSSESLQLYPNIFFFQPLSSSVWELPFHYFWFSLFGFLSIIIICGIPNPPWCPLFFLFLTSILWSLFPFWIFWRSSDFCVDVPPLFPVKQFILLGPQIFCVLRSERPNLHTFLSLEHIPQPHLSPITQPSWSMFCGQPTNFHCCIVDHLFTLYVATPSLYQCPSLSICRSMGHLWFGAYPGSGKAFAYAINDLLVVVEL